MCKLHVDKWTVLTLMCMYIGARTILRTVHDNSDNSEVKAGTHHGSCDIQIRCDSAVNMT